MIAGRVGRHTPIRFFFGKQQNRVRCTPEFERADFLKILAFEKEFGAQLPVYSRGSQDRRVVDVWLDFPMSLPNLGKFRQTNFTHRKNT